MNKVLKKMCEETKKRYQSDENEIKTLKTLETIHSEFIPANFSRIDSRVYKKDLEETLEKRLKTRLEEFEKNPEETLKKKLKTIFKLREKKYSNRLEPMIDVKGMNEIKDMFDEEFEEIVDHFEDDFEDMLEEILNKHIMISRRRPRRFRFQTYVPSFGLGSDPYPKI